MASSAASRGLSRSLVLGAATLLLAACASSPSTPIAGKPLPATSAVIASPADASTAAAPAEDSGPRIARIEHGVFVGARVEGDTGQTIQDRMRAHHVNGLTVAVIHDFQIAWAKGYGVSDTDTNAPVTETTLFQAGSISKPVFAMAVLKNVENGKLALTAKINDVLTSWKLPDNALTRASPVTLQELLSHTAGVNVHGFPGYAAGDPLPTLLQVLDGAKPANTEPIRVDLAPGTRFRYSGGGMTIAQQALMDVTREPFPQLMTETVLGPIGMTASTYAEPLPADRVPSAAAGYYASGDPVPGKRHVYPEMAAAGLWTTPSDLARFAIELALEAGGKSARVLSQASATRMLTKVAETDGAGDVGLGIFLSRRGAATYFGHDGADEGFQATFSMNGDKGDGVVMMANSDNGLDLMNEVRDAVATEYAWDGFDGVVKLVTLDPSKLAAFAGSYQLHPDRVCRLAVDGDHLTMTTPFLPAAALLPISDSVFVRKDDPARYTFTKADDGSYQIEIVPPPGSLPIAKHVADDFTVPLDDVAAGHIDQAAARYRAAIAKAPDNAAFAEGRFDGLGHGALAAGDAAGAMNLFRLNVALFPDSMNAYMSLAEGYGRAGDNAHAIATYRRAVATFYRDTKTPPDAKVEMRKAAIAKLKELSPATP